MYSFMSQLGGDQPGENYCCLYVSSICVSQFLLCVLYVSVSVCIVFVFCLVGTAATIKYLKLIYSFVLCPSASIQMWVGGDATNLGWMPPGDAGGLICPTEIKQGSAPKISN